MATTDDRQQRNAGAGGLEPLTPADAQLAALDLLREVERAVVGKTRQLGLILAGLLADGHVLLDDLPGVAKTLSARSTATAAGLKFARIQFTPDLLPSDVTGTTVLDLATNTTAFQPGPVFAQLVLADEINRAPAKTQAALLEAMGEGQVTSDGVTRSLPEPFLVIATQNPIESEGTYPLPEAQLDRFILRTSIGYPEMADEIQLLDRRIERATEQPELRPVLDATRFRQMQGSLELVEVSPDLRRYMVEIVEATRRSADLDVGASPRGSLALLKLSRAAAVLAGREYVTPDDVRTIAVPALAHRVVLSMESWARQVAPEQIVQQAMDRVDAPSWQ